MIIPGDIIRKDISRRDDRPAIITSGSEITYKELDARIRQATGWLNSIGVRRQTKAALLSSNNPHYVVLLFALWNLDASVIPLNIMMSDSELTEIINFSDAEFLFLNKDEGRQLECSIPRYDFDISLTEAAGFEAPGIDPDAISLLMFTSGVTGKPKGVMHSLNDLLNSADNSRDMLNAAVRRPLASKSAFLSYRRNIHYHKNIPLWFFSGNPFIAEK